jgi:hypothetical protein
MQRALWLGFWWGGWDPKIGNPVINADPNLFIYADDNSNLAQDGLAQRKADDTFIKIDGEQGGFGVVDYTGVWPNDIQVLQTSEIINTLEVWPTRDFVFDLGQTGNTLVYSNVVNNAWQTLWFDIADAGTFKRITTDWVYSFNVGDLVEGDQWGEWVVYSVSGSDVVIAELEPFQVGEVFDDNGEEILTINDDVEWYILTVDGEYFRAVELSTTPTNIDFGFLSMDISFSDDTISPWDWFVFLQFGTIAIVLDNYVPFTDGDTFTGQTSGATAQAYYLNLFGMDVTLLYNVTGDFVLWETIDNGVWWGGDLLFPLGGSYQYIFDTESGTALVPRIFDPMNNTGVTSYNGSIIEVWFDYREAGDIWTFGEVVAEKIWVQMKDFGDGFGSVHIKDWETTAYSGVMDNKVMHSVEDINNISTLTQDTVELWYSHTDKQTSDEFGFKYAQWKLEYINEDWARVVFPTTWGNDGDIISVQDVWWDKELLFTPPSSWWASYDVFFSNNPTSWEFDDWQDLYNATDPNLVYRIHTDGSIVTTPWYYDISKYSIISRYRVNDAMFIQPWTEISLPRVMSDLEFYIQVENIRTYLDGTRNVIDLYWRSSIWKSVSWVGIVNAGILIINLKDYSRLWSWSDNNQMIFSDNWTLQLNMYDSSSLEAGVISGWLPENIVINVYSKAVRIDPSYKNWVNCTIIFFGDIDTSQFCWISNRANHYDTITTAIHDVPDNTLAIQPTNWVADYVVWDRVTISGLVMDNGTVDREYMVVKEITWWQVRLAYNFPDLWNYVSGGDIVRKETISVGFNRLPSISTDISYSTWSGSDDKQVNVLLRNENAQQWTYIYEWSVWTGTKEVFAQGKYSQDGTFARQSQIETDGSSNVSISPWPSIMTFWEILVVLDCDVANKIVLSNFTLSN